MREVVLLDNGNNISPESTIRVKNQAVAERLAVILDEQSEVNGGSYYVPFEAVDSKDAAEQGINNIADLYGGVVRRPEHADKALLHGRVNNDNLAPQWYVPQFAKAVEGAVLPGYTAFSRGEVIKGHEALEQSGLRSRIKDPSERCARGQYVITNADQLHSLVAQFDEVESKGIVLESDLREADTIAVGYVALGGKEYAWCGKTWDVMRGDEQKFGGNELTVVRGGFGQLHDITTDPAHKLAIRQTSQVLDAYSLCGATISRATFDVVQGMSHDNRFLSGVTDPSIRPSASSPAEIHAVETLLEYPELSSVTSKVVYDYGKQMQMTTTRELFASSAKTNIFVETVAAR